MRSKLQGDGGPLALCPSQLGGIAKFSAHDLRRTGRTGLARLGIKFEIAERVLNHAREKIHAVYDLHEYLDEKRDALEKWRDT